MRERARRMVAIGEGALAGLLAGAVLGGWDVRLNDDVAHGTRWLAGERLAGPLLVWALGGAVVSAVIALAVAAATRDQDVAGTPGTAPGRGATVGKNARANGSRTTGASTRDEEEALLRRVVRAVRSSIVVVGVAGAVLALWPARDVVFPLTAYSSAKLAAGAIGAVLAAFAVLLVRRAADAGARRPRIGPVRAGLAWLGAAGLLAAVCFRLALPVMGASRAAGRPSIVLVSIDTLRADRAGFLGSDRDLTPRLDALASDGAVFEQATSAAPWTLPSHVSLFTSMLPFDHHVRWTHMHIHPVRSMLAERLRDAGYRTAAFTGGAYVASSFGFDQGFEVYEDHDEIVEGGPETIADHALAWARAARDEPFFLFVHTYEVHSPFSHTDRAPREDAGRLSPPFTNKEVEDVHQKRLVLTPAERRYVSGLYDGDVAHADAAIGGLLETLRKEGILDHAILVVLSDHGEDLWDHDETWSPGHGHSLYQELVHVPLFVRAPGTVPAGGRIRTPVSLLDVAPTLLEMAGLPPEPDHRGRSLETSLRAGREPESLPVWSESVEYGPDRFALREGDRKIIRTPLPERVHNNAHLPARPIEVFDLAGDPRETRDLSASLTAPEVRMAADVGQRAEKAVRPTSADVANAPDIPENLREQLRSLGYVK